MITSNNLTLYNQSGGTKSLGFNVNTMVGGNSLIVPAGLLYINNNFNPQHITQIQKNVIEGDIFDKLYGFLDKSKKNKTNKTKKKKNKVKRKNKTRRY
tara:strand:+ start:67 stop:360 length:294 start_codon:yes stop_codon:yes gene_type:complete